MVVGPSLAVTPSGWTLGSVPRAYEDNTQDINGQHTAAWLSVPHDPPMMSYMLPNAEGNLEVLAACRKHYAFIPKEDVRIGRLAACGHKHCRSTP